MELELKIPQEVLDIIQKLKNRGFQAYIVGGCVRDLLRKEKPKDWDVTTNAKPEEIQKVFPNSFLDNKFGTVSVLTGSVEPSLEKVEITPFRTEAKYRDKRHPEEIKWAKTLEEDLKRRDFTVNALAIELQGGKQFRIIDLYKGVDDLKRKIIRAVGDPKQRFQEDALRLIRAVRLATVLDFNIENQTIKAIKENAHLLRFISKERIRDEFLKIINAPGFIKLAKEPGTIFKNLKGPVKGIELLRKLGLLNYIVPELLETVGVTQNKHHIYDVYEHSLRALNYAAERNFNFYVRIAALFHDIGKPRTKRGEGLDATFYNHEIVGAKMTEKILKRLKLSRKDIEKIVKLVRFHLFYYNVGEVGEASVRRLIRNVGRENLEELIQVRMCDRIGSGVPKAEPYKLRHLRYMVEKVSQDPISVKMLVVGGNEVMEILGIKPGPKIGQILDILLSQVIEKPKLNKKEVLIRKIQEIGQLSNQDLEKLAKEARQKIKEIEIKRDEMTKKKYWVT